MRIAVWHDLPSGGGFRALMGQLRELQSRGHELAVWSPNSFGSDVENEWWPANIARHTLPMAAAWVPTFLDRRFDVPFDLWERRRRALHAHAGAATKAIDGWKPDVLLVHPGWWFYASPLALYWDGPSALYLQEPYRSLYEASPENPWAAPSIQRASLRSRIGGMVRDHRQLTMRRRQVREEVTWVRGFDRVLVNSMYSRESVIRAYGIDPVYCPLGADHSDFSSAPRVKKEPVVVSLGEVAPHKDPMFAVSAVAHVPRANRPQLRWFGHRGDEGYLAQVHASAKALDVDFTFTRRLGDPQLATEMARAACFLFCARLEPLGLSPLEANLAGTSVVAIAEGGVRETIVDGVNGTLVYNRDPEAMGAIIEKYVTDLEWAGEEGALAREHVLARHTWRDAGAALEQELGRVVRGAGAARARQVERAV